MKKLKHLPAGLIISAFFILHSALATNSSAPFHVQCGVFVKIYDPSVGETNRWYINDHCFIRATNGIWHMFGITHQEPARAQEEIHFAYATATNLLQQPWDKQPFALDVATNPPWNETHLWAPDVVCHDGLYYMFYCAGGKDHTQYKIHLATSPDLWTWTRSPKNPMVVDGYDARDPFVLRLKNKWVMYYCATSKPQGGHHVVACVTSDDLLTWTNRRIAFTDPSVGKGAGNTESPFVVKRGDFYYLFIGPRGGYDGTDVFASRDPFHWSIANKVGHIPAHAAEVVRDTDGKWYVSRAGWGRGGLYLAPLIWKNGPKKESSTEAKAVEPPVIPIGLDAYRQWDRWPYQRIGMRAYMRSTYDRRGGNESADASHFLYQLSNDYNVTLDVAGAGILVFARYNHWHGSPWHYDVDGADHLIQESSTANPNTPVINSVFLPADLFPPPLALTWSTTHGADLSWVPIPFEKSFRMAYSRTHYGTGYYIYDQFVPGIKLSHPLRTWDGRTPPARDVLNLINRAGTDIAPANLAEDKDTVKVLRPNATEVLFALTNVPSMLRRLTFSVPRNQAIAFGRARLRITWDGRKYPSVDAPVALFFGAGTLYNRDGRKYLVKAFPVFIRFDTTKVELACFFPMPFFRSARIELTGPSDEIISNIVCTVGWQPFSGSPEQVGYFHATYRDHPHPKSGKDLVLLDTRKAEGGGNWSGSFIGTSFIFSDRAKLNTLEGDPRFFFDDSQTPQAQGTGTEEWCGGGDYWGGQDMTLPFCGHPTGARNPEVAQNKQDEIESAYRFLLADLMPFGRNARIQLEHGGTDQSTEHYQTVAYWYGAPAAVLVKTDELKIGDAASETAHHYFSPQASAPYAITSRYEWGVDHIDGHEVYPAQTDYGRKTTGTSEFTLKLNPKNFGVLLCRKLDYSFPNQRAKVYVADDSRESTNLDWQPAGVWYLAGGNTCVYSNPKGELGKTQHVVKTSNRRFRDDEFLLPLKLTQGHSAIRVRIQFTPVTTPLFLGHPLPELAWSEIRYDVYCFVMPRWNPFPGKARTQP